jgi:hypothetical protein
MLIATTVMVASASTGLRTGFWSGSGMTLSTTSNSHSNATAFWQTILNSAARCVAVDGVFGAATATATSVTKSSPEYGLPATGVVDAATWNGFQFNILGYDNQGNPIYRHNPTGYVDGFADQYWTYYGGGSYEAHMAWNAFVPQWFLSPYPASQAGQSSGWTLIAASANRTIGSYPCNA